MLSLTFVARTAGVPLALAFTASLALAQTTWHVDASAAPPGDGSEATPYADLQFALAQPATIGGDTLLVAAGTYAGPIDFLGKDVRVRSVAGAATTFLDGGAGWPPVNGAQHSVVRFTSGETALAELDGFTIQHGRGTLHPLAPNDAVGGGVFVRNASPTLRNLVVRENSAARGAGMFFESSTSLVSFCTVTSNTGASASAALQGLGLYAASAIQVEDTTISENGGPIAVGLHGGGVWASAGTFTRCTIANNTAWEGAGAFLSGSALVVRSTIRANVSLGPTNVAGRGAGAFGGTLRDSTLELNEGAHAGGGAWNATLERCVLRNNRASRDRLGTTPIGGGGAASSTLVDCDVYGNVAGGPGTLGVPTTDRPTDGGGLLSCTATRTRIFENVAYVSGGDPSGIRGHGGAGAADCTLVECALNANDVRPTHNFPALGAGGAVFGGTASRCRIWGNLAPHGAGAANAALVQCTLNANSASIGGGALAVVYAGGVASANSSILYGNSAPETLVSGGTLTIAWSDVLDGAPGTGNIDADPLFQSVNNSDVHLLAGSPCIDAGDPALQDPDGTRADMGVFPFECGAHVYCVGKLNSIGCVPSAGFLGTPSLSGADDFHVTCVEIRRNALGLLLWSRHPENEPFFNGTRCVGTPFVRAGVQSAGGTGEGLNCTGHFDFHFSHSYMATHAVAPFETLFAQWYMRDATHPDGTSVGLSNAVSFTVCP